MATAAEVDEARRALTALVGYGQDALRLQWADAPTVAELATMSESKVVSVFKSLRDSWWMVAETYGSMSAALGQTQAAVMLDSLGRTAPRLPAPVGIREPDAAFAALTAALSQDDWLGAGLSTLASTVRDANRGAMRDAAADADADVIRVPRGATTCLYCLRAASYGPYSDFASDAQRAGFASKFHDHCDCQTVIVAAEDSWPDGYDPERYAEQSRKIEAEKHAREMARIREGAGKPGPRTRSDQRRARSSAAWADRQRIKAERDAAKARMKRATAAGDDSAAAAAQQVLDRTAAERAELNGTAH